MAEMLDIVNEKNESVGRAPKEEIHLKNMPHRHIFVFIFNKKGEMIIQKRVMSKLKNPGCWTASVSGHVAAGESYEEAAIRETMEELGVKAQKAKLNLLKIFRGDENDFNALLVLDYNGSITANKDEIDAVDFVSPAKLKEEIKSEKRKFAPVFKFVFRLYTEST